jgi:hypothetical protein
MFFEEWNQKSLYSHTQIQIKRSGMDPFQITITVIASISLFCNACLHIETNNRLDSLREDGKYIGIYVRDVIDRLDKLPKHEKKEAKKKNIFMNTKIEDAPD